VSTVLSICFHVARFLTCSVDVYLFRSILKVTAFQETLMGTQKDFIDLKIIVASSDAHLKHFSKHYMWREAASCEPTKSPRRKRRDRQTIPKHETDKTTPYTQTYRQNYCDQRAKPTSLDRTWANETGWTNGLHGLEMHSDAVGWFPTRGL